MRQRSENPPTIRAAGPGDMELLADGLRQLAADLGDPYRLSGAALDAALFGPHPTARAVVAADGAGLALFSPVVSTRLGGAGAYVSDLWVSASARGTGLGRRLLASGARDAQAAWGAVFLKLAVYDDNPAARAVYDRLGFAAHPGELTMTLAGGPFDTLKEQT